MLVEINVICNVIKKCNLKLHSCSSIITLFHNKAQSVATEERRELTLC